jgi:Raf kinase inhibitor-like YbhB/YbcL family protein
MKPGKIFKPLLFICVLLLAGSFFAGNSFALELRSSAFKDGEYIPVRYTGRGEDISPALEWTGVPRGTKSFALIMDDPDAPMGTWIHWVVYNIPADATGLKEDIPPRAVLDDGTAQGINSFRRPGYGGPYPPPGPAHRYVFTLYAIDTELNLSLGANKGTVLRAIQGHILGRARLIGLFKK